MHLTIAIWHFYFFNIWCSKTKSDRTTLVFSVHCYHWTYIYRINDNDLKSTFFDWWRHFNKWNGIKCLFFHDFKQKKKKFVVCRSNFSQMMQTKKKIVSKNSFQVSALTKCLVPISSGNLSFFNIFFELVCYIWIWPYIRTMLGWQTRGMKGANSVETAFFPRQIFWTLNVLELEPNERERDEKNAVRLFIVARMNHSFHYGCLTWIFMELLV